MNAAWTLAPGEDWVQAEPAGGDWCRLVSDGLHRLDDDVPILLELPPDWSAAPASALALHDTAGARWRLLPAAAHHARLQSLADCRAELQQRWRMVLAGWLADSVLHELRNPLNALVLQRDLLERGLMQVVSRGTADAASLEKSLSRLVVIRERLQELHVRQNVAVGLWLVQEQPAAPAAQPLLGTLEQLVRVLRSRCSQAEVRLEGEFPAVPEGAALPVAPALPLVMAALLCLAADRADATAVSFDARLVGKDLQLRLPVVVPAGSLAALLGLKTEAGLRGCIATMIDAPLDLRFTPGLLQVSMALR